MDFNMGYVAKLINSKINSDFDKNIKIHFHGSINKSDNKKCVLKTTERGYLCLTHNKKLNIFYEEIN